MRITTPLHLFNDSKNGCIFNDLQSKKGCSVLKKISLNIQ